MLSAKFIKYSGLIFVIGTIIGVALSPFANKPQTFFLSPVPEIQAAETNQQETSQEAITTSNTIENMFVQYDLEQEQIKNRKRTDTVTIAIIGDSMVDTMDTNLPYLHQALKTYYPNMKFKLFNYGKGGETVMDGSSRLDGTYDYKDRHYPNILSLKADIVIVESFAYNPLGGNQSKLYQSSLAAILRTVKLSCRQTVFLATIAPLQENFGKGPNGVNWDSQIASSHADTIASLLKQGMKVARDLYVPVIDVYHDSLLPSGKGNPEYVNTNDGIHPSIAGHKFIADTIAAFLVQNKYI